VISPTVVTGAGIAIATSALTAEYVNAAGESQPVDVRQPEHREADAGEHGSAFDDSASDGGGTESASVTSHTVGQNVSSTLETTFGPGHGGSAGPDDGGPDDGGSDEGGPDDGGAGDGGAGDSGPDGEPGNILQSQQGGGDAPLGDDVLVDFDQHIVVHELPDGQFSVESVITITVHHDGHTQTFTEHDEQIVTKEHADTDLVIRQDGDVVVHLDEHGGVTVETDGDLTVTEQPGDPHDTVPEGAVVVIQDQDLTVVDADDGIDDNTEDPHVYGHFEQSADATDDPGDGQADVFVVDQNQSKVETEVHTGSGETTVPRPPMVAQSSGVVAAPVQVTQPVPQTTMPQTMVAATVPTYAASPAGLDPAFGTAPGLLPDQTGVLDTPLTPVSRGSLETEPAQGTDPSGHDLSGTDPSGANASGPDQAGTDGHFEPPPEPTEVDGSTDPTADPDASPMLGHADGTDPADPQPIAHQPGADDLSGHAFATADHPGTDPSDSSGPFDHSPTADTHQQVDPHDSTFDAAHL
jgi:hypothetical protein